MDEGRRRQLTLLACVLGSSIVFVDQTVVNVALPDLAEDLDASLDGQQWVLEAYLLTLASLILLGGSLADLYGRRKIFGIGVGGFGAASLLCAIASNVEVLCIARGLQGIFGALLVPSSLAILATTFTGKERAAAIGTWTAWTAASIALGPFLGGILTDTFGWRGVFAINIPLVLYTLYLVDSALEESPRQDGKHIDLPGAMLCALGLAGPVYALIRQPEVGWDGAEVLLPMLGGVTALTAFVFYEATSPSPMLPLQIFKDRAFAIGNIVTFGVYAGLTAGMFYVAIYLQQICDYSATQAGLALLPVTLIMVTMSRRFGEAAATMGHRLFITTGPIIAGAGLLLYRRLDLEVDYFADVLPASVVFGLGLSMTVAPLTAAVLASTDRANAGVASGVNNAVSRVAGLIAIAIIGAVIAGRFESELGDRLPATNVGSLSENYLDDARDKPLTRPDDDAPPGTVIQAEAANVEAFHTGMLVAGLLVLAGGAVALVGLKPPPKRRRRPATEAPVSAAS